MTSSADHSYTKSRDNNIFCYSVESCGVGILAPTYADVRNGTTIPYYANNMNRSYGRRARNEAADVRIGM